MNNTIWKILSMISAILMLTIGIIAFMSINICPMIETAAGASVPMKCHWAFTAESWIAIIGIATSLLGFTATGKEGRRIAIISTLVVSAIILMILTPAGIGTCAHDGSSCDAPALAIWILCILNAILSVAMMVKSDPEAASKPKMTV